MFGSNVLSNSWLLFGDPNWTDYDFEARVLREAIGTSGVTLLFRSQGPGSVNACLFNMAMGGNSYGGIEVNFPGEYFAKEVGGIALPVLRGEKGTFANERWYTLKAEVRGSACRCFVDGEPRATFDHLPFARGRVGVRIAFSTFRIRDVRVTRPDGSLLWTGTPDLPPCPAPVPEAFSKARKSG